MNLLAEYILVLAAYFFVFSLAIKLLGGKELRFLDEEIRKQMEKYKKSQKLEDARKLNELSMKKLRRVMKVQLPLLPLIFVFLYVVKNRYGQVSLSLMGLNLNWFWILMLGGIFLAGPMDRLAGWAYKKIKKR